MHLFDPAELLAAQTPLRALARTAHLWAFSLRGAPACVEQALASQSPDERARADRLRFAQDRSDFVVARGVLRSLLARYRGVPAQALRLESGPAGKPRLGAEPADPRLRLGFNLSHSRGRALLALGAGRELGVDLEQVRAGIDTATIAASYFFGTERAAIDALEPDRRAEAFFRFWVAKEAVLKAEGVGLGVALDRFELRFHEDGVGADVHFAGASPFAVDWTVRMLPVEAGWSAALATQGPCELCLEDRAA